VAQFRQFLQANPKIKERFDARGDAGRVLEKYSPDPDCPIILVNWYLAAAYCNWLSEKEKIEPKEWCYDIKKENGGMVAIKLREQYLKRKGYRLPTEAEWEYACRAEAATARYFGGAEELLARYGWYLENSKNRTHPVGALKPNDFGFFDTHGNVWNWCQERYKLYSQVEGTKPKDDIEDIISINNQQSRVLRGGSFYYRALVVRAANRDGVAPSDRGFSIGFRPARTFTP